MRQGQQNRRGRGRNNNHSHSNNNQHRKGGQNPISRSYESAGPDTKIRGTPAHIAEKYMQLARDAQSAGDPVLAENYLQHAEHYNRIILTYREQQIQNGEMQPPAQIGRYRAPGSEEDFGDDEGSEDFSPGNAQQGGQPMRPGEPQPRFEGGQQRFEERQPRGDRQDQPRHTRDRDNRDRSEHRNFDRSDRQDRGDRQERGERSERFDRPDRGDFRADRGDRSERGERPERSERRDATERSDRERPAQAADQQSSPAAGEGTSSRRRERAPMPAHEQPEFLRRPVRRPRRETADEEGDGAPAPATTVAESD